MPEGGRFHTRLTGPALGMLAVGFVLVFAFAGFTSEFYRVIELKTLDLRFRTRAALPQSSLILHVDIDDTSIKSFGRWPWAWSRHARALGILKELGARAVVFDVEFPEPSNPQDDKTFADALSRTRFSFLPFRLEVHDPASPEESRLAERIRQALLKDFSSDAIGLAERLGAPKEAVSARFVSLKESVARSVGWEILRAKGTLAEKALFDRLMPESDPLIVSVENRIIPAAVDYCLAVDRVYRTSALDLPAGMSPGFFTPADEIRPPIHALTEGCIAFGASNALSDPEDGVIRHLTLFFVKDGQLLPHLSLMSACWALGTKVQDVEILPGRHVKIRPVTDAAGTRDPIVIPVDDRCRTIVNWAGRRGMPWRNLFEHVPYGSILELHTLREDLDSNDGVFRNADAIVGGNWSRAHEKVRELQSRGDLSENERARLEELTAEQRKVEETILDKLKRESSKYNDEELKKLSDEDRELVLTMKHDVEIIPKVWGARKSLAARETELRRQLERKIRDRLCIIGMTASASTDLKPTPVSPELPGVAVHSAVINSILQRSFIHKAPEWVNVVAIVLVGLAVSLLTSHLKTRWAAVGSLGVLAGWTGLVLLAFALGGWWVAMAGPVLAGFLSYASVTAYRQLTEERQKRQIRHAFQHYLSPTVVEEVLKNPETLKLGGERKELTVLFSDVTGFTPIAETMEPEDLVALLNDYLSEMSDVILKSKGYINKYEGDAILAVFGAPLPDPHHARAACQVALDSQRRLQDFREKLIGEKRPIIRARIGINSGIMIVGNMGSRRLFDYTVMGDNVNIGARLESAGKHFGTEILIGENTYRAVKDAFDTRRLGLVYVKGRSKPVGAYELLAEKGKCPPFVTKILRYYEEGLAAYADRKWDVAIAAFAECLKINPKDGPSRAYLHRSKELSVSPAPEPWDGTFTLEGK